MWPGRAAHNAACRSREAPRCNDRVREGHLRRTAAPGVPRPQFRSRTAVRQRRSGAGRAADATCAAPRRAQRGERAGKRARRPVSRHRHRLARPVRSARASDRGGNAGACRTRLRDAARAGGGGGGAAAARAGRRTRGRTPPCSAAARGRAWASRCSRRAGWRWTADAERPMRCRRCWRDSRCRRTGACCCCSTASAPGCRGAGERDAFAALPPMPAATAGELCRLVLMGALPALAEGDLAGFGDAVTRCSGRSAIISRRRRAAAFTSPRVAAALERLAALGAHGLGQSSWGPSGFAFAARCAHGVVARHAAGGRGGHARGRDLPRPQSRRKADAR